MLIVGLGDGPRMRKSVELAKACPNDEFVGVELCSPDPDDYLFTYAPPNLRTKFNTDCVEYLRTLEDKSVDHIYAHFLLQYLRYGKRQELFAEVTRVLNPDSIVPESISSRTFGVFFTVVDEIHYKRQLEKELVQHGFDACTNCVGPQTIFKLATDNGDMNAEECLKRWQLIEFLRVNGDKVFPCADKEVKSVEELEQIDIEEVREIIQPKLFGRERDYMSDPAVVESIAWILEDMKYRFVECPFVVIAGRPQ